MNCQNHPDVPATAFCRACGKPLCDSCRRDAYGTVYCAEHAPVAAGAPSAAATAPPLVQPRTDVNPGLALFLGFIPGVGAIYNGQYAKGLVHAVVFGVMISILDSGAGSLEVVFGILLPVWVFYMAFEAYHTARKRLAGEPVDEYSSIINLGGRPDNAPVAGIVLVVLGVLLLLHTLHIFDLEYVTRYWPVLLIAAGVYLLYGRFAGHHASEKEVSHER
jgi:TM2 domain-containing membrane protein YozV